MYAGAILPLPWALALLTDELTASYGVNFKQADGVCLSVRLLELLLLLLLL